MSFKIYPIIFTNVCSNAICSHFFSKGKGFFFEKACMACIAIYSRAFRTSLCSTEFVPRRAPSYQEKGGWKKTEREGYRASDREGTWEEKKGKRRLRATLAADVRPARKMESDTTVRRIKPFGNAHSFALPDKDQSRQRCGDNGYSGDPKRKPDVSLYLLREGPAASLVSVFILALWALVHLSLQQLVIGKPTGDFNAVSAR